MINQSGGPRLFTASCGLRTKWPTEKRTPLCFIIMKVQSNVGNDDYVALDKLKEESYLKLAMTNRKIKLFFCFENFQVPCTATNLI